MLVHCLVILICAIAAILQYAVHRTPSCPEGKIRTAARRVTLGSLVIAIGFTLEYMYRSQPLHPDHVIVIGLFALGQVMFAMESIFGEDSLEEVATPRCELCNRKLRGK